MWNKEFTVKRTANQDLQTVSTVTYTTVGKVWCSYSPAQSTDILFGGSVTGEVRQYSYSVRHEFDLKIGDILESDTLHLKILSVNEYDGDSAVITGVAERVDK